MTHKDAPPETTVQQEAREWHTARLAKQGECVGWGRDKHGHFLSSYARTAEAAWQAASASAKRKLLLDLWDALDGHERTANPTGSLRATLLLSEVGDEIRAREITKGDC